VIIRSILFNILFYMNTFVHCIGALISLVLPRRCVLLVSKSWAHSSLWLLKPVCGIGVEWRGLEKIPPGPLLIACKHQSVWETFVLLTLVRDPAFIVKRELIWIPLFGWAMWRGGMIPVNRSAGSQALSIMTARANTEVRRGQGRQIIIFPEGTRRPAGAEPKYKYGIAHLYDACGVPCVPIALNSGLFWPRRSFLRYPGTVVLEVLDPIPPGLDKDEFFKRLRNDLEAATAKLVEQGRRELAAKGLG
jgi:1-acyl-sn-glycerol-3-phosphate acyltransferase